MQMKHNYRSNHAHNKTAMRVVSVLTLKEIPAENAIMKLLP